MSFEHLLNPRSVAVVGATPRRSLGGQLVGQLVRFGFRGEIYPVNPKYDEVHGIRCYASLDEIGSDVDVVAVATPAETSGEVLRRAYDLGTRAAVVVSGMADVAELTVGTSRTPTSPAICGPNGMGLISLPSDFAPFAAGNENLKSMLLRGRCAVLSQSGGMLLSSIYLGSVRGLGFSYLVSSGNETFTNASDYIEHFATDDQVDTLCWIMEGIKDGDRFEAALARFREAGKNLVVLPVGRSDRGRASVLSHTGSLMGQQKVFHSLLNEYDVPTVTTPNEMIEMALYFEKTKPTERRGGPAVLAVSGGTVAMAADLSMDVQLELPRFSAETIRRLAVTLPGMAGGDNPIDIDLTALYQRDLLHDVLTILADDESIDELIAILPIDPWGGSKNMRSFIEEFQAFGVSAAIPACLIANTTDGIASAYRPHENSSDIPFLQDIGVGLGVVAKGRRAMAPVTPAPGRVPADGNSELAAAMRGAVDRARSRGSRILSEIEGKQLLADAGLTVVRELVVRSRDELEKGIDQISWPAVSKVVSDEIAHRAKDGLIALNLESADDAFAAYDRLVDRCHAQGVSLDAIVIQEQVASDFEVVVGVGRDPVFGPSVVVGAGGVFTEIFDDTAVIRARSAQREAAIETVIDGTLGKYLDYLGVLGDYRDSLTALLKAMLDVADSLPPSVASIDVNPVLLSSGRCIVVDALFELGD